MPEPVIIISSPRIRACAVSLADKHAIRSNNALPCRSSSIRVLYADPLRHLCINSYVYEAADLVERLTDENAALREKVPQWISVEERRPEPGKRALATDGVFVGEAYRTSADTWRRYDGIAMRDCLGSVVTHWLPLPDAPAEGGKHE